MMRHYGDFPCYTVWPAHATPSPGSTIYLHGGGYVSEIQAEHWNLISDIACETGKPVHVPIYGLAPEHHDVEAILFIEAVMADASAGGPMYLAGDSAGAGLALSATLDWLADGGIPPCGLTLIGPWLDITLRDPTSRSVSPRDPWLGVDALHHVGRYWADDLHSDEPRVSPIFGDLSVLPHVDRRHPRLPVAAGPRGTGSAHTDHRGHR